MLSARGTLSFFTAATNDNHNGDLMAPPDSISIRSSASSLSSHVYILAGGMAIVSSSVCLIYNTKTNLSCHTHKSHDKAFPSI